MKKFLILMLTVLISVSAIKVGYAYDELNNKNQFLSSLGITDGITLDSGRQITRAEFVAMVVRALNISYGGANDMSFSDVNSKTCSFVDEIYIAKSLRLTNGVGEGVFSPNTGIGLNDACKMLVVALGHGAYAENTGGYPYGYMAVADRLSLTDGVTPGNTPLIVDDAITLVYNALYAEIAVADSVWGSDVSYKTDGTVLLGSAFNLESAVGVVSSVGFISDTGLYDKKNTIEIDGNVYNVFFDCERYFGKEVTVWYDKQTKTVRVIDESDVNSEVVVDSDNVSGFSDGKLTVTTDDGKDKVYNMDSAFAFLKNGRIISHQPSDFVFADGSLTLIDNNADNRYDYVLSHKTQYFVVRGMDKALETVYDTDSVLNYINLSDSDEAYIKIYTIADDGSYVSGDFSDISRDDVLRVYVSDDRKVCKVYVSSHIASGVISEEGDDYCIIDSQKYYINNYFNSLSISLTPGAEFGLRIADDGTVTDVTGFSDSNVRYGYLLDFNRGTGLGADVKIKLLDENNNVEIFDLAEKIKIDSSVYPSTDTSIDSVFKTADIPNYMLVCYSLNSDGKLSMIDTSSDGTITDDISVSFDSSNRLTKYVDKLVTQYKSSGNIAMPSLLLSKAVVFTVPSELTGTPAQKLDDRTFRAGAINELRNDATYTMDIYDLDRNYYPGAAVVFKNSSDPNVSNSLSNSSKVVMIEKVSEALDSAGDDSLKIYALDGNRFVEYYVPSETWTYYRSIGEIPSKGDIARVTLNGNKVTAIRIDVDYDETTKSTSVLYGVTSTQDVNRGNSPLAYISGEVVCANDESVTIVPHTTPESPTGNYPIATTSLGYYNAVCNVFNRSTGEVYSAKLSDIGSGIRTDVICKLNYFRCNAVYMYVE